MQPIECSSYKYRILLQFIESYNATLTLTLIYRSTPLFIGSSKFPPKKFEKNSHFQKQNPTTHPTFSHPVYSITTYTIVQSPHTHLLFDSHTSRLSSNLSNFPQKSLEN